MTKHKTGTREEWLLARLDLLTEEKDLTRRSDELARRRQELPWVRIDKEYRFETDEGSASLADLFQGRTQLLVYHFMFEPDYKAGCPTCSTIADGFNGFAIHLANHDVMLWAVSRAPLPKLQAHKRRMEWTFPWASSFESEFNYDYGVAFTEEEQRSGVVQHNYRSMSTRSELRLDGLWACTNGLTARLEDGTRPGCKEWVTSTAVAGTAATTSTTSAERSPARVHVGDGRDADSPAAGARRWRGSECPDRRDPFVIFHGPHGYMVQFSA